MIVTKKDFISKCLKVFGKYLEEGLPEDGFEFEMIDKACEVIGNEIRHIKKAWR